MSKYPDPPDFSNVISLFDDSEFAHYLPAGDGASAIDVLENMMSNARFSTPANDDPQLSNLVKLAPRREDCRQARLLCMWAEILAEDEIA